MDHYVPILVFTLVAISVPIIILLIARVVRFGSYDPVKAEAYECGNPPSSYALDSRFSIRYYLIAVLFVVFDVEVVFMLPWAVAYNKLGLFALVEMVIFVFLLVVALVYTWRKGALQWS